MPVYVALLRGINVGGNKRVKMDQLRKSFEALGFSQVRTFIQSGNVVFKAARLSPAALSKKIEEKFFRDFGFPSLIVTRTLDEIDKTVKDNPFARQSGIDPTKLHVTFLSEAPAGPALKKFEALVAAPDQSCCAGKEIYFYLPNGMAQSSLAKTTWERTLSVTATTRNWNTVNSIYQMCMNCE